MKAKMWVGILAAVFLSQNLLAWGQRGHALSARVAARLLMTSDYDERLGTPFFKKAEMLGHVANIPDAYWKNLTSEVNTKLHNSHWFQIDELAAHPSLKDVPRTIDGLVKQMAIVCKRPQPTHSCSKQSKPLLLLRSMGTAPWRVEQFANLIAETLRKIKNNPLQAEDMPIVDKVLEYAGLQSHFVTDMANPQHASYASNGWETNQGGLHSYFEDEVVNALPSSLEGEVFAYVREKKPFVNTILPLLPAEEVRSPVAIVLALAIVSQSLLDDLLAIDQEFAVLEKSSRKDGKEIPAKRRPAAEVAEKFRKLAVTLLANGADTLAYVWSNGWEAGGKPDLTAHHSYKYSFTPEPIYLDYIKNPKSE